MNELRPVAQAVLDAWDEKAWNFVRHTKLGKMMEVLRGILANLPPDGGKNESS